MSNAIGATIADVDGLLLARGFARTATHRRAEAFRYEKWRRRSGDWRIEEILISREDRDPHELSILLVVQTALPEKEVDIDVRSVRALTEEGELSYPLPTGLFGRIRVSKFVERIASDIEMALAWLEQHYGSPRRCLLEIEGSQRNGFGLGTQAHASVVAHLSRLVRQERSTKLTTVEIDGDVGAVA